MKFLELLGVFGGLALFLHGMQMMSSGLEAAAGSRMKSILERLTANRFINAGMMTLNQAVWLIMGANVGTTITGLLIALDVGALAPVVAFAGVFLMVFVKEARLQHIGQIMAGLGILWRQGGLSSSQGPSLCCSARISAPASPQFWPRWAPAGAPNGLPAFTSCST